MAKAWRSIDFNANRKCVGCGCPVIVPAWKYCLKCTEPMKRIKREQKRRIRFTSDMKIIHAHQRTTVPTH